jgi:hypothetical protein
MEDPDGGCGTLSPGDIIVRVVVNHLELATKSESMKLLCPEGARRQQS